eukprot:5444063-Alexandrium_andersonii.AAC.1
MEAGSRQPPFGHAPQAVRGGLHRHGGPQPGRPGDWRQGQVLVRGVDGLPERQRFGGPPDPAVRLEAVHHHQLGQGVQRAHLPAM